MFLKDTIMKRIFTFIAISLAAVMTAKADDRPVTFEQLPAAAQSFINNHFQSDRISYATVDDDLILPDYTVVLVSGVKIQFSNNGSLEKIDAKKAGVPEELIPVQILDYVKRHYQDVRFVEYEIDRRSYETKLSNGMELRFNKNFALVGIDD